MQPTKIALQNFLSYGDVEVGLDGLQLAAVLGANGAGKSSIATDAITWPLYGEGRYKDIDRYIRQGQENAVAELQFMLADETYRVIRTRSNKGRGKSTLELARQNGADWIPMSGTGIRETQDKIRDLLRMDYETFVSSCVLLQGGADRFTTATPGERMAIFSQIIGLDTYDRLLEAARVMAKNYRDQAAVKRATMDNLDAELAIQVDLQYREEHLLEQKDTLVKRVADLENELEKKEKQVNGLRVKAARGDDLQKRKDQICGESDEVDSKLTGLDSRRQRVQQIIDRGDEIRQKAAALDAVKKQLAECEDKAVQHVRLSQKVQKLNELVYRFDKNQESDMARLEAAIKGNRTQAELLEQVPCAGATAEACKLLKSARDAAAELPALEFSLKELSSRENHNVADWEKAKQALTAVGYDSDEHGELRDRAIALEKWAKVLPELEQAESNMTDLLQQVGDLQRRWAGLAEELGTITAQLAEIEALAAKLRKCEGGLFGARQQLKEAQEQEQDIGIQLGTVRAQLKDLEDKAQQKRELESEVAAMVKEEHLYTKLARAYREIPVLIMENALPDVEDLGNELLGRLTGGRISVRFETQKEAKTTGTVSDTLDIIVGDELGERPYEGWSGAERFDVDLSIRLAISKFLAKRAGAKIETLIIDEGASCLDAQGREHFTQAINEIAKEFKLVLCITHIDELKEHFPQQLIVSKTPEGSRVEVVA